MPTKGLVVDRRLSGMKDAAFLARSPSELPVVVVVGGKGCLVTRNVSKICERAMAAATQTTGVRVSMRRTMTPAK